MGEQPIFTTRVHVFQIDPDTKKKWLPVSSQPVPVSFYHDTARSSYRIISLDGSKALVNSTMTPNMTFTKTSQKFGQWADHRVNTIYGLGFSSEVELIKFMEKFNELKDLVNASITSAAAMATDKQSNDVDITVKPEFTQQQSEPGQSMSVTEQLKYDNERLKLALTQSASNAKKWEQDMQILRNNNARLTSALQESNTNVDEWKVQLATYKEENSRMKAKLSDVEKNSGSVEVLQHQLLDVKAKLQDSEQLVQQKHDEANELRRKVDELKQFESQCQKLSSKLQAVEDEKLKMRKQVTELQQQLQQVESSSATSRQQLLSTQQMLSTKINELYEMNDKLADLLHASSLA